MRTIEEVVNDILDIHKCKCSSAELYQFANEILAISKENEVKGDLISRSALIEDLVNNFCDDCSKCGGNCRHNELFDIVDNLPTACNNGWIACEKELPPMPKENPMFENKPLELYLVSVKGSDYPWRAFWNGKYFTDGWNKADVIAWQPLQQPYKENENGTD